MCSPAERGISRSGTAARRRLSFLAGNGKQTSRPSAATLAFSEDRLSAQGTFIDARHTPGRDFDAEGCPRKFRSTRTKGTSERLILDERSQFFHEIVGIAELEE